MNQINFKNLCAGLILICILGIGISLIAKAQQEESPKYTILVFGKLHLTPTGDAEIAEKLLKEKLLLAAKGIEGLKITALKRMQLPGPRAIRQYQSTRLCDDGRTDGCERLYQTPYGNTRRLKRIW